MGPAFLTRGACAAFVVAVALTPLRAPAAEVLIANDALRIGVDDASGVISRITHAPSGIELLTAPASVPFLLDSTSGGISPTSFAMTRDPAFIDGEAWDLAWQTGTAGLRVEARIELRPGS